MKKQKQSKLDEFSERLDDWFADEEITLSEARDRLAELGCLVSIPRLSEWRRARRWEQTRRELLEQIGAASRHCQEVEEAFGQNPAPGMETLLKMHRSLIFELSARTNAEPEAIRLVNALLKPVIEWARLQEHVKVRELAEQKYRDEVELRKAAVERELRAAQSQGGLSPETLEKIERELNLM